MVLNVNFTNSQTIFFTFFSSLNYRRTFLSAFWINQILKNLVLFGSKIPFVNELPVLTYKIPGHSPGLGLGSQSTYNWECVLGRDFRLVQWIVQASVRDMNFKVTCEDKLKNLFPWRKNTDIYSLAPKMPHCEELVRMLKTESGKQFLTNIISWTALVSETPVHFMNMTFER